MSEACVFCEIVAGRASASIVHEDEDVVAFMDIRPVVRGHLLVIPRRHASGLADLEPEDGARVFRAGHRLAAAMRASGLPCEGVNLWLADGEAAGQEVFHVHLHVLPRHPDDGFSLRFPMDYGRQPTRNELEADADAIRRALG